MVERNHEELAEFVRTLTERLHPSCTVTVAGGTDDAPLAVSIQTPEDARMLIGKDGQNLKALEHVVRAVWARRDPSGRSVTIDVNDYRKTRTIELVTSVHETARRVRDTKRSEALNPMTSYDRRVVHTELAAYHDLATESIGQEPHRRVVIKPL